MCSGDGSVLTQNGGTRIWKSFLDFMIWGDEMVDELLRVTAVLFEHWRGEYGDWDEIDQLLNEIGKLGAPKVVEAYVPKVVDDWLGKVRELPIADGCMDVVRVLGETAVNLHWIEHTDDYAGEEFAKNFAYVQLVGPLVEGVQRSPYFSDKIRLGFSLQAPHIFYPPHKHKAVELYGILAGEGLWQYGEGVFEKRPSGTLIRHPSYLWHAMKTEAEPMLTVYAWFGDLFEASTILSQATFPSMDG